MDPVKRSIKYPSFLTWSKHELAEGINVHEGSIAL